MENNNQDQGKEAKKVLAGFDKNMKTIVAIVGGDKKVKISTKVPKDAVGDMVTELFKEEREEGVKAAKLALKTLLKGHATLNQALIQKRKELDAHEVAKKKEFNAEAAKVFAMFENLGEVEKQYYTAFQATAPETPEVETEEEEEENND